ncbi:MAG: hypothetical protein Kow0029_31540 [Candidatus Rifleibacteriota bacterium]
MKKIVREKNRQKRYNHYMLSYKTGKKSTKRLLKVLSHSSGLKIACLVIIFGISFPLAAHAYIDPGTGSFVFQLLISALVGGIFILKTYWQKLKNWIYGSKSMKSDEIPDNNSDYDNEQHD